MVAATAKPHVNILAAYRTDAAAILPTEVFSGKAENQLLQNQLIQSKLVIIDQDELIVLVGK
jgi:hypothetical protein